MSSLIKFKGIGKLEKSVKDLIRKKANDEGLKKDCAEYIVKSIKGSARNSGKDIFSPYEPLAESTKAAKKKEGKSWDKPKLTDRGDLLDSISYKTNTKKPLISIIAPGNHYSGLSNQELLMIHHDGTAKIPARPIFGWSEKMIKVIQNKFRAHLRRSLAKK